MLRPTDRRQLASTGAGQEVYIRARRVEIVPGQCSLVPVDVPTPGPGQFIVRTLHSIISPGTERAAYLSLENVSVRYPWVPGYSQVGEVMEAGPGSRWRAGQTVVTAGPHTSAFSWTTHRTTVLPAGVRAQDAAFAGIGVVAQQGVRRAAIMPGERVLILGAGLIGQLAAQLARIAGAEVIVAARSGARLNVARRCGFLTLDIDECPDELTRFQVPVVIDATGDPRAINNAVIAARQQARIVLLGSPRGTSADVDLDEWRKRDLIVLGSHVATLASGGVNARWTWEREASAFLEFTRERLCLDPLLTATVSPRQLPDTYRALANPSDRSIAVRIDWLQDDPSTEATSGSEPLFQKVAGAVRSFVGDGKEARPAALARGSQPPYRFGMLGCGEIAVLNAAALRASRAATITFAVDQNVSLARSIGDDVGASVSDDLRSMLDSREVDAVLIATPHHLHASQAIQCLRAGKNVIVEKPMSTSAAECDEMIAVARECGRRLSVLYAYRFDTRLQRAAELIAAGAIGAVLETRVAWAEERSADYWRRGRTGRTSGTWRAYRRTAGGGVLIMNACHLLDAAVWLVGAPVVEVFASIATLLQPVEVEDVATLSYRHDGGVVGTLSASTAFVGPPVWQQFVNGTEGQIAIAPTLRLWSRRHCEGLTSGQWHEIPSLSSNPAEDRRRFFEEFIAAIAEERPGPACGGEARHIQSVVDAAYVSATQKRAVAVERPPSESA